MDYFTASLHTQLTEPKRKELGSVLADQDEVAKIALNILLSDIEAMEGDRRLEQQQWQMEKEKLKLEIEAAHKEEQIKCQAADEGMAERIKKETIKALEGDRRLEQRQWQMEKEKLMLEIEAARKEEQIKCQVAVEGMAERIKKETIEALEGDRRLEQQQWQMEKEKLKLEVEAARKEEQIKCQAAVEGMAERIKKETMERLEEREQMEAEHKSLIAQMKRDEEEKDTSSKKVTEALMKEVETLVASRDQELKAMEEHYEDATSDLNLMLRVKHEIILSLEKERDEFKVSVQQASKILQMRSKQMEDLVLSEALNTAAIKQRLVSELRTQAETWMFGNASENSTDGHMKSMPNVFLKWRIRDEWRNLQGNQAFFNADLQNCCFSKEIETLILSINAAQDKINLKYKKQIDKIRNEAKEKEAKLVQAELKETSKLEKKKRERMEKIQQAELKEEKKRQMQLKKQREQMQIKEKKEQEKEEAKELCEAKRAETESRGQNESQTGRRRFFRACF